MNAEATGILVVDKPIGLTSHDVVARVRRLLGTRRVGHAGTLDPMATGVLVVLVGEATKLAPFLSADDKEYAADIELGRETASHDRDGATVAVREVSEGLRAELHALASGEVLGSDAELARAIAAERERAMQAPPIVSAIHVDGRRSHARARAGEAFAIPPRPVMVRRLDIVSAKALPPTLSVRLAVTKGYYVRALARDIGETLGTGAHLTLLRRLRSGCFGIEEAVELGPDLRTCIIDLSTSARRALPVAELSAESVERAHQGKPLRESDFASPPPQEIAAWMSPTGALVAIGGRSDDGDDNGCFRVVRGFQGVDVAAGPVARDNPGR